MVDMNVIILDGIALYIALAIVLFMIVAIAALAWSGIKQDEKIEMLNAEITSLKARNVALNHEKFYYKLKYGEFDPGKEP